MAKNFVFNMGFDPSQVIACLTQEGVDNNSTIHLLTPENRKHRQEAGIGQIENYLDQVAPKARIEIFDEWTEDGFEGRLKAMSELLEKLDEPIVSLSGGSRDFLIPLTIAASQKSNELKSVYLRSDLTGELSGINLPNLSYNIDEKDKAILKCVGSWKSLDQIQDQVNLSKGALSRRINRLKTKGLVETETRDGKKYVISRIYI